MPNLLNEMPGLMAFVRTVEAGSFSAAARDLATTPSAVSKSVARLEKKIGARLFLRSTRALMLTQDGQLFFDRVAPLLRDLDASEEAIRSDVAPSGRLRISMPSEMALYCCRASSEALQPTIRTCISKSDLRIGSSI